jgi:hypothetical protein
MRKHQRFCSRQCRLGASVSRRTSRRRIEHSKRQQAAWLAAMAGTGEVTCSECGSLFAPVRSTGRYCSARCRLRAYRAAVAVAIERRIERVVEHSLARAHQGARAERRRRLVLAAARGDTAAIDELRKLDQDLRAETLSSGA